MDWPKGKWIDQVFCLNFTKLIKIYPINFNVVPFSVHNEKSIIQKVKHFIYMENPSREEP